jgi:hypothetical protein
VPQGPGRTQRQIAKLLVATDRMTAIEIARALMTERGYPDTPPTQGLITSVHRSLRALEGRGEVRRIPVEDGLSQWAFELVAAVDPIAARLTTAVQRRARTIATGDYTAVVVAVVDALPDDDARALVDLLTQRLARGTRGEVEGAINDA